MTETDKLEALIQKAIENNFPWVNYIRSQGYYSDTTPHSLLNPWGKPSLANDIVFPLIFNHDFVEALFGEESDGTEFVKGMYLEQPRYRWKHHLQQAVIASNPVDYMYGVVFGD